MPNKKRLYEIAKELGRTPNDLIAVLAEHHIQKKNFSAMEDSEVEIINRAFAPHLVQRPVSVDKPKFQLVKKANSADNVKLESDSKHKSETEKTKTIESGIKKDLSNKDSSKNDITQNVEKKSVAKNNAAKKESENKTNVNAYENSGASKKVNAPNNKSGNNRPDGKPKKPAIKIVQPADKPKTQGAVFRRPENVMRVNVNVVNRTQEQKNGNNGNNNNNRGNAGKFGGNNSGQQRSQGGQQRPQQGKFNGNKQNQGGSNNNGNNLNKRNGKNLPPWKNKTGNNANDYQSGGQKKPHTDDRQRNKFNEHEKKEEHVFVNERNRGDRRKKEEAYRNKKQKGQYVTKESRPNRSKGHEIDFNRQKKEQLPPKEIIRPTSVEVGESINVKEFSQLIKRDVVNEVIKKLFLMGMTVTINQDIDFDTAVLIGDEFGCEVLPAAPEVDLTEVPEVDDPEEKRLPRPPVVTVMGHVDHGKTSLLDAIRATNVTAREAGGITQHIGASKITYNDKQIVFLDTPGHEAFTAMRARGAQVTDITVLVVAADDGVMPQTLEAINHAKAAKVPIIVAINKIDKPSANPDRVKQQLAENELVPEDWGGDVVMVSVSAHKKTGINDLLEMIQLSADMQELKANPDLPARGTIIEAQLDKGRGPVATVLVQRGTLHIGDAIIAGTAYGKVRAMINDKGEQLKEAGPSTPVEVLGLNAVPQAGDILDSTEEHIAHSVAEKRLAKIRENEIKTAGKVSLDDLYQRIKEGEIKDLNVVVKADVQGSVEALKQSLEKIKNDEVKVAVVHSGVGAITESDIMLASAANALVIGFNVRPDANARKAAEKEKVDTRMYRVIYDALEDVENAIKGMLAPTVKEVIQGRCEVRQVIHISKLVIAGCYVTEGKVTNNSKVRVVRDGIVIHEGNIDSLRRFKDDVKEVQNGFECGLTLEKFTDLHEQDQLEIFTMEEVTSE